MSSSALSEEGSDLEDELYDPTLPELPEAAMDPSQPDPATEAPIRKDP